MLVLIIVIMKKVHQRHGASQPKIAINIKTQSLLSKGTFLFGGLAQFFVLAKWQVVNEGTSIALNSVTLDGCELVVLSNDFTQTIFEWCSWTTSTSSFLSFDCFPNLCRHADGWRSLFFAGHISQFLVGESKLQMLLMQSRLQMQEMTKLATNA